MPADRYRAYLVHVARKLATLSVGAAYVSPFGRSIRRRLARAAPSRSASGRAAIVAHVFYPDLLPEILECFGHMPDGSALVVTAPASEVRRVETMLRGVERARVVAVANKGRDIAPFVHLLNGGALDPFDAVLKIHTKKSPHLRDGDIRRQLLFAMLAGSRRRVARVLRLFDDPSVGLVGWGLSWHCTRRFWMNNRARVERMAAEMGMPRPANPAFFEGSMFWVRPAALKRLAERGLEAADFEAEAGQLDGALHHAVERMFAPVASAAGFRVLNLGGRSLPV